MNLLKNTLYYTYWSIKNTILLLWAILLFPFNYCRAFYRIIIYTSKTIQDHSVYRIDLSDLNLLWIPQIIVFYPIEELVLSGNRLFFLPLGFSLLKKRLRLLELEDNCFLAIPTAIWKCNQLNTLKLSGNYIKRIPAEVRHLKKLALLFVSHNRVNYIDSAIGDLTKLWSLNLSFNPQLCTIPSSMGQLIHLNELSLYATNITKLPISFKNLDMATNPNLFPYPPQSQMMPADWLSSRPRYPNNQGFSISYKKLGLPSTLYDFRTSRIFDYIFSTVPEYRAELIQEYLGTEGIYEKKLDFSELQLDIFPFDLALLKDVPLYELDLSNNQLATLPKGLETLTTLKKLLLGNNKLRVFPKGILALTNLEFLDLSNNAILTIPNSIYQLHLLTHLYLYNAQIKVLPHTLFQLKYLETFLCSNNQIKVLPSLIGQLKVLRTLSLSNNEITKIPSTIGSLKRLHSLYLRNNGLQSIPNELVNLSKLETFTINKNNFPFRLPMVIQLCSPQKVIQYILKKQKK